MFSKSVLHVGGLWQRFATAARTLAACRSAFAPASFLQEGCFCSAEPAACFQRGGVSFASLSHPVGLFDTVTTQVTGITAASHGMADRQTLRSLQTSAQPSAEPSHADEPHAQPLPASLLSVLHSAVSGRISTNPTTLASHGKDESYRESRPPQAVVLPHSTEEIAQVH